MNASVVETLAALLRGQPWTEAQAEVDAEAVLAIAETEGVVALVAERLTVLQNANSAWRTLFAARAQALAIIDLVKETELRSLLEAFRGERIDALVMKGAHLAYDCYARPDLRPRLDTDLVVRPDARSAAERVLSACGYTRLAEQQDGDLLMYQSTFVKSAGGVRHTVDLHWRVLNPHVFREVFDLERLFAASVPLPRLSASIRAPGRTDALLLACLHRVVHHRGARPLIWTYDIHLLASECEEHGWQELADRASTAGIGVVVRESLREACDTLGSRVPEWLFDDPRLASGHHLSAYLNPAPHAQIVLGELRSLPDWHSRWKLALQMVFPSASYMRDVYARGRAWPLPLLYLVRIWRGARRWLRPSG